MLLIQELNHSHIRYLSIMKSYPIIVTLLCLSCHCSGEKDIDENSWLAYLTLNIINFTSWPESHSAEEIDNTPQKNISLCVAGDNAIYAAIKKAVSSIKSNRKIKVTLVRANISHQCDAIFILNTIRDELFFKILASLKNGNHLTISNFYGMNGKRTIVTIRKSDNKKHEISINLSLLEKSRIKISSRLLKLPEIKKVRD